VKGVPRHRRRALPAAIVVFERLHEILGMPLTIAAGGLRRGVLGELDEDRFHDNHVAGPPLGEPDLGVAVRRREDRACG